MRPVRGGRRDGDRLTIVITMQHPADVHFFKHPIAMLRERGHEVAVFVRANGVAVDLLAAYGIDHTVLVPEARSLAGLALIQARFEYRLWRHARRLDPDVMAAVGGVAVAHVGTLLGARTVVFTDTEHATIVNRLAFPFADTVCTPACFAGDPGDKHRTYPGVHELVYLHPARFTPDPAVLDDLNVAPAATIAVLRISSWHSSHDVGASGFDDLVGVLDRLTEAGAQVIVSSEIDLPAVFDEHRRAVPPHRMHDLLGMASLYIGEGATMAAESAVLGTPSIYVNSLTMGYIRALAARGPLFPFHGRDRQARALDLAASILAGEAARDVAPVRTWGDPLDHLLAAIEDRPGVDLETDVEPAAEEPRVVVDG